MRLAQTRVAMQHSEQSYVRWRVSEYDRVWHAPRCTVKRRGSLCLDFGPTSASAWARHSVLHEPRLLCRAKRCCCLQGVV